MFSALLFHDKDVREREQEREQDIGGREEHRRAGPPEPLKDPWALSMDELEQAVVHRERALEVQRQAEGRCQ